jgi:ribonuclease HI
MLSRSKRRLGAVQKIAGASWEIKTRHVRALWCGLCASVGLFAVPIWGPKRSQLEIAQLNGHKAAGARAILGLPKGASALAARSEAGILDFEEELGMESAVLVSRAETRTAKDEFSKSVGTRASWATEGRSFAEEAGITMESIEKDFIPAEFITDAAADVHRYIAESNLWLNTVDPMDPERAGENKEEISSNGGSRPRSEEDWTSDGNSATEGDVLLQDKEGEGVAIRKFRGKRRRAQPNKTARKRTHARNWERNLGEKPPQSRELNGKSPGAAKRADEVKRKRAHGDLDRSAENPLTCDVPQHGRTDNGTAKQPQNSDVKKAEEEQADVWVKIHSDGSVKGRRGGYATCINVTVRKSGGKDLANRPQSVHGWPIQGLNVDAFVAEQFGVRKALKQALAEAQPFLTAGKKVWFRIVTDSLSVIQSIGSAGPRDRREREITQLVGKLVANGAKGELAWERGHCGRAENEACDKKAKLAVGPDGQYYPRCLRWPWHVARAALKERAKRRQVTKLEMSGTSTANFLSKVTRGKFQPSPAIRSLRKTAGGRTDESAADVSRITEIVLNQMRVNCFSGTQAWAHRINRAANASCPHCGAEKQDTLHLLLNCPAYSEERDRLRNRIRQVEIEANKRGPDGGKKYIRGLGRCSLQNHPLQVAHFIEEAGLVPHSWAAVHREVPLPATGDFPDPSGRKDWKIPTRGCHIVIGGSAAPVEWEVEENGDLHLLCSSRRFKVSPDGALVETAVETQLAAPNDGEPISRTTQQEQQMQLVKSMRESMQGLLETYLPGAPGFVSP